MRRSSLCMAIMLACFQYILALSKDPRRDSIYRSHCAVDPRFQFVLWLVVWNFAERGVSVCVVAASFVLQALEARLCSASWSIKRGEASESHAGPAISALEDSKDEVTKPRRPQHSEKEPSCKVENCCSDKRNRKRWRTQENEAKEARNKVGPQSHSMSCDDVDQITDRKSDPPVSL